MIGTCAHAYVCTLSSFVHMHVCCASIEYDKEAEKEKRPNILRRQEPQDVQTPTGVCFVVKKLARRSLDGISTAVDCEVHRPCRLGSLTRGEQRRESHGSAAGPGRF